MCSILALLDLKSDPAPLRARGLRLSRLQRHRGPDRSGIYATDRAVLVHERLAIVDVLHGAQPLLSPDGALALAVNGEIYNHRELRASLSLPYPFRTASDCEVILALYRERGADFLDALNGIFAFVLYDAERDRYLDGPRPPWHRAAVRGPRRGRDAARGERDEGAHPGLRRRARVSPGPRAGQRGGAGAAPLVRARLARLRRRPRRPGPGRPRPRRAGGRRAPPV